MVKITSIMNFANRAISSLSLYKFNSKIMTDQLKEVRPYMNLADSLEDSNPIFAYYLRKYSIQKAHQVYTNAKSTNPQAADAVYGQLSQWMPQAEQLARKLQGQIDISTNLAEMLDYTDRVFLEADNSYRAKNYSLELTQNFMTAWRFYEVINHFSPLNDDQAKRLKYAKVKTIEVHKQLKQMQSNPPEPYKPQPPQVTPGGPSSYKPEPPVFTPGGGMSKMQQPMQPGPSNVMPVQPSAPYVPEVPQFTPGGPSNINSGYPTMSGIQIPQMPNMNFTPFPDPVFSQQPPVFNGMGQSGMKPPQQPSNISQQPASSIPANLASNSKMQSPVVPQQSQFQQPPNSFQPPNFQQPSSHYQQPPSNYQQPQAPAFQPSQAPVFQPSQGPSFPNFQVPQAPGFPSTQAHQASGFPSNQAGQLKPTSPTNFNNSNQFNPSEAKKDKKRLDPERIAAQSQAITQLQNAISELSFNRVSYAKEAARNALKLLEKYD